MIQTWTTDTGTPRQPEEPGYKVVKAWFQKCRDDAAAVEAQKQKIQRLRDIASKTTPSMTGMPGGGGAGDKIGTGAGDIVDEERHLQQMEVDLTELRKEAVRRAYEDFESVTGYGTGAGLCGWNCRHTFFSVFPELGPAPNWTQESLAELNARDIEYDGQKYTRYEISQMQRARERAVRKWKRRYLAEDAARSDTTVSAVKLRAARAELADFVAKTGSRADSARTMVSGFGRSASGKAAWAAKYAADNIRIGRSVGAKAKNYVVVDKSTGEEYYFVEGTRTQNAQVFAGKGGVKPLREEVAQGLAAEFGGKPEEWQHCKAQGWLDVDGEAVKAEVHWFQNGSEKVKFKVKRWFYDED